MSTENVYKLLALGETDPGVRAELQQAGDGEAGAEAVAALGKKRGFDFTAKEALTVAGEVRAKRGDDVALSDDEVAGVAGGASTGPIPSIIAPLPGRGGPGPVWPPPKPSPSLPRDRKGPLEPHDPSLPGNRRPGM